VALIYFTLLYIKSIMNSGIYEDFERSASAISETISKKGHGCLPYACADI
jgi:hypothetical protein